MTRSAFWAASREIAQELGIVTEVGVHLEDELVVPLQRPAEPGQIGLAQPRLPGPVQDVDPRLRRRHLRRPSGRCRRASCRPRPARRAGDPAPGSAARSAAGSWPRCTSAPPPGPAQPWQPRTCALPTARHDGPAGQPGDREEREQADQLAPRVLRRLEVQRDLLGARAESTTVISAWSAAVDRRRAYRPPARASPCTRSRSPADSCGFVSLPVSAMRMLPGFHSVSGPAPPWCPGAPLRIGSGETDARVRQTAPRR